MTTGELHLPPNWASAELGEVCDIMSGYGFPESLQGRKEGQIPFYKVGDISDAWKRGAIRLSDANHYLTMKEADSLKASLLPTSTTVFAKIGAAIALNRRAMLSVPALVDNNVMGLHPRSEALHPAYLFYFACTLRLNEISQATTVPSVRKSDVSQIKLPLPPSNEQQRIVGEIEIQFARLDAAVAALKRVQANLKRYRAAVLKAACEGRLVPTEAELARREGRSYEPASELLKRILAERRARWEANQLRRTGASSKASRVDNWKLKYAEPIAPKVDDLLHLPEGWCWISLDFVVHSIEAGKNFKCEERPPKGHEVGVVKVSAVTWGEFDELETKTCPNTSWIVEKYIIRPGDFLFSRANTIELIGACVIVKHVHGRHMLSDKILRLGFMCVPTTWVLYCLRSLLGRHDIERLSTGNQESMRNIGQDRIKQIRIPLPPLAEIARICAEAERGFSIADALESQTELSLKRADRLRQAILKRAFEGKLVPQDPNDEPASVLLERIRSERGLYSSKSDQRTRKKPRRPRKPEVVE